MSSLKMTVLEVLEKGTDLSVFYERAEPEAKYPYFVFELRRLSENAGIEKYVLEVNGWDQSKTASRIEAKMDELERNIHSVKVCDNDRTLIVYKGQKAPLDDEDKRIKRCREQFEMFVCERR